jgi:hypothetical protein
MRDEGKTLAQDDMRDEDRNKEIKKGNDKSFPFLMLCHVHFKNAPALYLHHSLIINH